MRGAHVINEGIACGRLVLIVQSQPPAPDKTCTLVPCRPLGHTEGQPGCLHAFLESWHEPPAAHGLMSCRAAASKLGGARGALGAAPAAPRAPPAPQLAPQPARPPCWAIESAPTTLVLLLLAAPSPLAHVVLLYLVFPLSAPIFRRYLCGFIVTMLWPALRPTLLCSIYSSVACPACPQNHRWSQSVLHKRQVGLGAG